MKNILVYVDEGVSPRSVLALFRSLKTLKIDPKTIKRVDRHHLIESSWEETTSLLIFPGGRDIPYHEALKGPGTKKIRSFVENGGRYLGFCAGAYFGTRFIEFEMGGPLEVTGKRDLAFFEGKASGPAYGNGTFSYEDEREGRIAKLNWQGSLTHSYYNGGCLFENASCTPNTKIIATYEDIKDSPAAAIDCQVKKGRAILCGVHPEYDCQLLSNSKDIYLQKLATSLKTHESKREEFFKYLIELTLC